MKTADIKIGTTYAYDRWPSTRRPSSAYQNAGLQPITVTGIVQERVHNRSTYGTRLATLVVGTIGVDTVKVNPRGIVCTWDEVKAARAEQAKWENEAATKEAQRRNELDPVIAKVEAYLRAKGVKTSSYGYDNYYLNTKTGEAVQQRPKAFDGDPDSGWEYVSVSDTAVLDRQAVIKSGKVTLPLDIVAGLLPPF